MYNSSASLRLLVIVNYPPEFGGLAKGAHKLDIFAPIVKVLHHLLQVVDIKVMFYSMLLRYASLNNKMHHNLLSRHWMD